MQVVVGIDLGSTTTKAVLLDAHGELVGRGITNSRSNYTAASAVARDEALTSARFSLLERALRDAPGTAGIAAQDLATQVGEAFRLALYLDELGALRQSIMALLGKLARDKLGEGLHRAAVAVLDEMQAAAEPLFLGGEERKSDFFRDVAGAQFVQAAEREAVDRTVPFERLVGLFDRAILDVETRVPVRDFLLLLPQAVDRVRPRQRRHDPVRELLAQAALSAAAEPIDEIAFAGTGYGRQTLPFPKECVRSEILCHGRGAHRVFPHTRTVLDIGGQDTKAIQVDQHGVVTSFQMNDRCAAGCGRYLGYIADELNLALHELGPLALRAQKIVRVNSTCTVFAGAELRERLALGQRREDILAGLHKAILLRAMSLLARSGGVKDEFTFTGGVCKNPMATQLLRGLIDEHYGSALTLNIHPDSIFMGALGGAMFALDDVRAGKPGILPRFAAAAVPAVDTRATCAA